MGLGDGTGRKTKAEHAAEATGDAGEKDTDGKGKESHEVLPLGAALVSVTMRLLFTRQLTVDMFSTFDANAAGECVPLCALSRLG